MTHIQVERESFKTYTQTRHDASNTHTTNRGLWTTHITLGVGTNPTKCNWAWVGRASYPDWA